MLDDLLRNRDAPEEKPVGFAELFFDLVFVFAVTQLTQTLAADLSLVGVLQTSVLFLAIWWTWLHTAWVTNWLEPERTPVRIMLFVLMLGGLLLAATTPAAFGKGDLDGGRPFAFCYVAIQLGRSAFMLVALSRAHNADTFKNFLRLTIWLAIPAPVWIVGAFEPTDARLWLWFAAVIIDYLGPLLGFPVPGLGRSAANDWDISGGHLSERCGLFIIIALGEAIIVIGTNFSQSFTGWPSIGALLISFVGSMSAWWIYFDVGAKRAAKRIEEAPDAGILAREAFTYAHVVIIAGLIVTAVADKKAMLDPTAAISSTFLSVTIIGHMLFLFGNLLFKQLTAASSRMPRSHVVGLLALPLIWLVPANWSVLVPHLMAVLVLMLVAMLERMLKSEPTPDANDPKLVIEVETV